MRVRFHHAAIAFVLLAVTACQTAAPIPEPPSVTIDETAMPRDEEPELQCAAAATFRQEGVATFYATNHNGKKTANGEIFNMNALTAAHRTLPFGSRIRVTNLDNGRIAEMRVNDRGPYVRGRILDVSRRAATDLNFIRDGRARVRIETITPGC